MEQDIISVQNVLRDVKRKLCVAKYTCFCAWIISHSLLRFCRDDGKPLSIDDWELLQSKVDELHLDIGMIDVSNNERERLESEDC